MRWTLAGAAYVAVYVLMILVLADHPGARLWSGNIGLLIPPLIPIAVVMARRHAWSGRALVFWTAMAAGCALWFLGQAAWMDTELRTQLLPWIEWPVALKLCGGMLPMVALLAWPHASIRGASPAATALDIVGVASVSLFLFWSLIVAPGLAPAGAPAAVASLRIIARLLHLLVFISFASAALSVGPGGWQSVYRRCAWGVGLGALLVIPNGLAMAAGSYATGAFADIGWIVPFLFYAHAAREAPASAPETPTAVDQWQASTESGLLLLGAIVAAPVIGYLPRYILPLGQPLDRYRDLATSATLAICCGLAVARVAVEQRQRRRADFRLWLLATACEQTAEMIVIINSKVIEYANHSFRSAFGYSLEELRVLPTISLVAPSSMAAVGELATTLRRHEVAHTTLHLKRRDGTTFQASCTVAPLQSASGRANHYVGVVRDLTEELRLRDQLVRNERMSAVGELVSSVAHEINNPLQSVLGRADLLMKRPFDDDTQSDLRQIRADAERVGHIVRQLLTFVRRTSRHRELLDLNDVTRVAAAQCAHDLAAARVVVRQHYADRLPIIYANGDEIAQVVIAIVKNAREAMASTGGLLNLRTYRSLTGAEAVLEIADDGPGVAAEAASRIFEPFFSTKLESRETGLGLSVAFGIIASHGGALELVPADRGACFRIMLPGAAARI